MKHKGSGLSPSPDNIFRLIGRYCSLSRSYLRKRFLLGTSFFVFVNLRLELGLALHLLVGFCKRIQFWSLLVLFLFLLFLQRALVSFGFSLRSLTRCFRSVAPGFSFQPRVDTWAEVFLLGLGQIVLGLFLFTNNSILGSKLIRFFCQL